MKRISLLLSLLAVCIITAAQAQTTAPKPDPALKQMHVWLGHWTAEEELKPGPWGPGGKFTLDYTGQMIFGGFFYQGRWTVKGVLGDAMGFDLEAYDPENKNFVSNWYQNNGMAFSGVLNITGTTHTFTGRFVLGGKPYRIRSVFTFAPDLASITVKSEMSADGKTWTPFTEGKYTKAKPAGKEVGGAE
jgi:hypothetical protein